MDDENDVYETPRGENEDEDDKYYWDYGAENYNDDNNFRGEKIELKTLNTKDWENSDIEDIMSTISDPKLLQNLKEAFAKIDGKNLDEYTLKTTFTSAIETTTLWDEIDTEAWRMKITIEDKEKFNYEQKVNNLNSCFEKSGVKIYINTNSNETFDFLKNLKETTTEKRGEINGYTYNDHKIIKRNKQREFYLDYKKEAASIDLFLSHLEKNAGSAWAEFSNYYKVPVDNETEPKEYIKNMREEEVALIDSATSSRDLKTKFKDFIEMEDEIKKVKLNKKVKLRLNVLRKSFAEQLRRLKNWAWKNRKKTGFTLFTLIIGAISSVCSTIPLIRRIKKAGNAVQKMSEEMKKMANDFYELTKDPSGIFRYPLFVPTLIFAFLGQCLAYFRIFSKLGISWFNIILIMILSGLGKIYITIFDIYKSLTVNVEIMAEKADNYLVKQEKIAYLNSGRDIPLKLTNEETQKYEEKMIEYESALKEYEIEKESNKRKNAELNEHYEWEMKTYRKQMENYKKQLKQKDIQISKLKEMEEERKRKIESLNGVIEELGKEIDEKQKDVNFWQQKNSDEKHKYDLEVLKLKNTFEKEKSDLEKKKDDEWEKKREELENYYKMEIKNLDEHDTLGREHLKKLYSERKNQIRKKDEQEKLSLIQTLEGKHKFKMMEEQKVYQNKIQLLQKKLNEANDEKIKLIQEMGEKEKEKEKVKTKHLLPIRKIEVPVLPKKPKLLPTIKKPIKPLIPHQKMKLNTLKNKNPSWKNELMFWLKLPSIKLLQFIPWAIKNLSEFSLQIISWVILFFMGFVIYTIIKKWRLI